MSGTHGRTDWAEDDDDLTLDLPQTQIIKNKDGTETIISYKIREDGKRVKTTQRIKRTVIKRTVNPRVAERKTWPKFGAEKENPQARNPTQPATEDKSEVEKKKANLKDAKIKCRICSGDHWTTKCPFKDTMAPEGEPGAGDLADDSPEPAATGEKMGGKYERDDLATLRVTNVSEFAEENDLRDMFSRFGHVTRVFLAKDRDTGRAKGFAFVSFADRTDAAKACEKMDGYGFGHLILRVEFAKKAT
ncbi:translation initiation factor eIF3 subunit g [Coniosporium tulheliwenetii]|uniref:Translation initiation factor eIF3 subunit g n=1 Tax=Coniosporium tulheliwenetii TaxID=3383036 RepID=A0ACC2YKT6_9PEZI|nr:translation initiation factor eIF3 subunit g [Cladosporium sp. JES 115]